MKICVVAPSQDYLLQAGVRIRYLRIVQRLRELGHDLVIEVIDDYRSTAQFTHDVYLLSKCYDARARIIGHLLRGTGKLLGVDLFDDYFSQHGNSRFACQRQWLRSLAPCVDFYLCSTPRMKEVGAHYMPQAPGHILNDPFDSADAERIAATVQSNLERTLASGEINVVWFGVGDHPQFPVGLHDLHAFSDALRALQRAGWRVCLRVLTNRRALTASGLELLGRLPVPFTVDEWSIEGEQALLATCLLAFIPVNGQAFSIAKSLNRAVSALTAGAQVLSPGYPLYRPFGDFIYDTPEALLADLDARKLRLRGETLPQFGTLLATYGDPAVEAARYAGFLSACQERKQQALRAAPVPDVPLAVVHGVRSVGAVHQFAQRVRQLSVASPFSSSGLNYDLRFAMSADGRSLEAQFSENACARLPARLRSRLASGVSVTGRAVHCLDLSALYAGRVAPIIEAFGSSTKLLTLARYGSVMSAIREICESLVPDVQVHVSETEPPFVASPAPLAATPTPR